MAKSSRVKRRALQSSRKVRRGGFSGFYVAVAIIIISGIALVLVSRKPGSAGSIGPRLANASGQTDHWHAAVGVNVCGTWEPGPLWPSSGSQPLARHDQPGVYAGLHTHTLPSTGQSDGLIHMEPSTPDEAGRNATFGKWLEYGGWKVSTTSVSLWAGSNGKTLKLKNGDKCPNGKPGIWRWARGEHKPGKKTALTEQHSKVSSYKLFDQDVIALYFEPKGTNLAKLGSVPSESNLANPSAGEGTGHTNATTTSVGSTSTTAASSGSSTTATTTAGSSTTNATTGSTAATTTPTTVP